MRPLFRKLCAVAVVVMATPTLFAQDAPVPADAPIVVRISGAEAARARLGEMLGNALPDMAPQLAAQLKDAIENDMLDGRDISAVAKDKPVFLVFTDLSNIQADPPAMGILVPVTSGKEFRETFLLGEERETLNTEDGIDSVNVEGGETLYLADKGGYVAVAPTRQDVKVLISAEKTLTGAMGKDLAESFQACDVVAYVNLKQVMEEFKDEIEGFKQLMQLGLQQGGVEGADAEELQKMIDAFLEGVNDVNAIILGVEFRPEGANLRMQAEFGSDTKTNTFLKQLKPTGLEGMGRLPAGEMFYSGFTFDGAAFDLMGSAMLGAGTGEAFEKAIAAMKDAGVTAQYQSVSFPMSGLTVMTAENAQKAVDAQLEMLKAMGKEGNMAQMPLKGEPKITEGAEDYKGFKLSRVEMEFDLEKMFADNPQMQQLPPEFADAMTGAMEKMIGKKTNAWIGTDGKVIVQASGQDWAAAKKLIDAFLASNSTIGGTEAFQFTRGQLPKDASVLTLIDTGKFVAWASDFVGSMLQAMPADQVPAIPSLTAPSGDPAYLGVSIVLKDRVGRFDLFVPTTAVQQVRKMIEPLFRPID